MRTVTFSKIFGRRMTSGNISPLIQGMIASLTVCNTRHPAKDSVKRDISRSYRRNCDFFGVDEVNEFAEFTNFVAKLAMVFEYEEDLDPEQNLARFHDYLGWWVNDEAEESKVFYPADLNESFDAMMLDDMFDIEEES